MNEPASQAAKVAGDVLSVSVVAGTLMQILPAVAALFTIVWTGLRIYESATVQGWLAKRRKKSSETTEG